MTRSMAIILALGLALVLAAPAAARPPKPTFDSLDRNHDRKIDLNEWLQAWVDKEAAKKRFHQLDRDRDGVLSEADARAIFAEKDRDHDGRISRQEYLYGYDDTQAASDAFVAYDSNRDAYLSWDEWRDTWPFMP